jgi:hypothetical protein
MGSEQMRTSNKELQEAMVILSRVDRPKSVNRERVCLNRLIDPQ